MPKKVKLSIPFVILIIVSTVWAQDENSLQLSLSRDFGFGLGSNIQGTFSYRVTGPDNLMRVEFLLDGEIIAEDTTEPFRYQFRTESYPLGDHSLSAKGYTDDGREIQSNVLRRQFVSGGDTNRVVWWLIIPILVLTLGGRLITSRIANRGQNSEPASFHGPFGGTLCPKCGRPFALHLWGLNLVLGKFDRCPHCGKWSIVRRVHPDILRSTAEAFAVSEDETIGTDGTNSSRVEADFHRKLEDSRFND
jgi:hypothetical protein